MKFPRHTDHHNAGCDKPDNDPLCQAALFLEEWVLEKQDIPFCFDYYCFVWHKKNFNLSHLSHYVFCWGVFTPISNRSVLLSRKFS